MEEGSFGAEHGDVGFSVGTLDIAEVFDFRMSCLHPVEKVLPIGDLLFELFFARLALLRLLQIERKSLFQPDSLSPGQLIGEVIDQRLDGLLFVSLEYRGANLLFVGLCFALSGTTFANATIALTADGESVVVFSGFSPAGLSLGNTHGSPLVYAATIYRKMP